MGYVIGFPARRPLSSSRSSTASPRAVSTLPQNYKDSMETLARLASQRPNRFAQLLRVAENMLAEPEPPRKPPRHRETHVCTVHVDEHGIIQHATVEAPDLIKAHTDPRHWEGSKILDASAHLPVLARRIDRALRATRRGQPHAVCNSYDTEHWTARLTKESAHVRLEWYRDDLQA